MLEILKSRVIGQDEALMQVSRVIKMAHVGLRSNHRPVAMFLFLGPTGVGKTELARALAEMMFDEDALLVLDMYDIHSENMLEYYIGSSPGYSQEGGKLLTWVGHKPRSVIVFDEIEIAHPHMLLIWLQILEEARLIDSSGNVVDFSETVIILTSNLGANHLAMPVLTDEMKANALFEVNERLPPELVNRLDEIVMFNALSEKNLADIWHVLLKQEARMLVEQKGITLTISEAAAQWLFDQHTESEYGARPFKRIIRRSLREPLAEFLIELDLSAGTEIKINKTAKTGDSLTFSAVINGQNMTAEG